MTRRGEIVDDLDRLLEILPSRIREELEKLPDLDDLIEIVLDLGRIPEARLPDRFVYLGDQFVTKEDLERVQRSVGEFGSDNRAGIERTLHRISAIRNRQGEVVGLTCRVGRAVFGTMDIVRDIIESGKNILLLGRPGVGKTTLLREVARVLADDFEKRVVIVDTSNEIAGDGDVPHPAIGHARRMQVPHASLQAAVMIEAVENHMPEVIVIDEIGTEAEAFAARTIAERGVELIGTAHGNTLENLVLNPTLSDLIGGIQAVTLSDEEARKRRTQKTVLERKAPPTFDVVIEIQEKDRFAIHSDVATTVDAMLRGVPPTPEVRVRTAGGQYDIVQAEVQAGPSVSVAEQAAPGGAPAGGPYSGSMVHRITRIFPYAISQNKLEKAMANAAVSVHITKDLSEADLVLTLKGQYRKMPKKLREAEARGLPVHVIKSNTVTQIENFLREFAYEGDAGQAILDAERGIQRVKAELRPVELLPQSAYYRKLQHELAEKYNLKSVSIGEEPRRRVMIFPH